MMIWGGLLYLKNLDVGTVYSLSHDRDRLIRSHPSHIAAQSFRYIPNKQWGRNDLVPLGSCFTLGPNRDHRELH